MLLVLLLERREWDERILLGVVSTTPVVFACATHAVSVRCSILGIPIPMVSALVFFLVPRVGILSL